MSNKREIQKIEKLTASLLRLKEKSEAKYMIENIHDILMYDLDEIIDVLIDYTDMLRGVRNEHLWKNAEHKSVVTIF